MDKLTFIKNLKSKNAWTIYVRSSPKRWKSEDGKLVLSELGQALPDKAIRHEKPVKKLIHSGENQKQ